LKIKPDDCEALTYKADAVLEINEPQWAANLCQQALELDPDNGHAFYQLACAYTALQQYEEALSYLSNAIAKSDSYRDEATKDDALKALRTHPSFEEMIKNTLEDL
jgi:tetratricopeptide (TPR) repeat protein